jgi:hypothetical protein
MQVAKNAMELFGNGQGVETPKPLNPEQENA